MTVSHDCSDDEGSVNSEELDASFTNLQYKINEKWLPKSLQKCQSYLFILRSSDDPDPPDPLLLLPVFAAFFRRIRCIREAN